MARFVFGSFLLLFGLAVFSDQFNILNLIGLNFGTIMSLFWVVVGIALLIKRHNFWGTVLLIIGGLGFLSGIFHFNTGALFLPVVFIALGVSVLFKKPETWVNGTVVSGGSEADMIKENVAFAGLERHYTSQNFQGGKVDAAFGGFKLDLRDVKLAKAGAVLEINAAFGGGEILVPSTMRVLSEGSGVMGGWSNTFSTTGDKNEPALVIKGTAVFGGVEVKN